MSSIKISPDSKYALINYAPNVSVPLFVADIQGTFFNVAIGVSFLFRLFSRPYLFGTLRRVIWSDGIWVTSTKAMYYEAVLVARTGRGSYQATKVSFHFWRS